MTKRADIADKLPTRRREQVILALLSTRTIAEAAAKLKVLPRQVHRHLANDEFMKAYTKARVAAFKNAVSQLAPTAEDAFQTLREAMKCEEANVRVRAAIAILDKCFAWIQGVDYEDRLQGVERDLGIIKDERIAADEGYHAVEPDRLQKLDEAEREELNALRREKLKADKRFFDPREPRNAEPDDEPSVSSGPPDPLFDDIPRNGV